MQKITYELNGVKITIEAEGLMNSEEISNLKRTLMINSQVVEPKNRVNNNKAEEDYLLTVKEVAARLKTTPGTVYKLINNGLLTSLKIGALKVRNKELNRFLNDNDGKDLSKNIK